MEYVPLIEISSEDDFLIPSSSQEIGIHTGSTMETEKLENVRKNLEEVPYLSNSPEQNQKGSDRYNLRKSLAWDSAFLTGEGILNHEELATMNNTRGKAGTTLPRIEELRKSSESSSTLDSDSWALDHLELNLFDNVRDSIQRSLVSSNHTTNMVHYEEINEQKKIDASNPRTPMKIDDSSEIKSKLPTSLRRHGITRKSKEHTSKDGVVCVNLPSHGNAESKPLIRPPKISSKTIRLPASVPGKKASIEVKEIKGATAKQPSIVAFNKAHGVPPARAPRTTLSTKPTSGSQTGLVLAATLESSSSLTTCSANSRSVSSVATVEKRSANRINSYSSLRTSKTLLNVSINGSTGNLVKPSLVLSNISPASSIDSVVSESSSSTTTSTKLGKSLDGSDAGSSSSSVAFSASFGVSQSSGSLSQSFVNDRSESSINGDCGSRLARPSGLRVPRPTIGYFDKEKTLVRGSNKAPKASLQNSLMKNASVNSTGATNKLKPINHFTVRDRGVHSALLKQASKSAENFLTKIENHQNLCPKVNKISSEALEQTHKVNFENERVQVEKVQLCNSRKKEEPNLLHPNVSAREAETETVGEQKTHYQSYITYNQQENVKNDQKAAGSETEKENTCPELRAEDSKKMQKMEIVVGGDYLRSPLSVPEAEDFVVIY